MKTKLIRVEQETADVTEIDKIVNKEIQILEEKGNHIHDVKLSVGRDAWWGSGVKGRYSVTIILMYDARPFNYKPPSDFKGTLEF